MHYKQNVVYYFRILVLVPTESYVNIANVYVFYALYVWETWVKRDSWLIWDIVICK